MAGKIKAMIDHIIAQRSQGIEVIALSTRIKLMLKGIDPDKFNIYSEDDPEMLAKVKKAAREMGVTFLVHHGSIDVIAIGNKTNQ